MNNETKDILVDIQNFLTHQKDLGNDSIPKGASLEQEINNADKQVNTEDSTLESLRKDTGDCTRCKLCKGRTNLVFGDGNANADLMFVGEGPGFDEDQQGIPFVGKAGRLLTKIIEAMGLKRKDVYIANIVKCRPPNNRNPETDEIETCFPFLLKQIEIIEPKIIVCLGAFAAQTLLKTDERISKLRGKISDFNGIKLIPTFHPAFLLRNQSMKKPVWEDMKLVMKELS